MWEADTFASRHRMELHYALVFCELLGRVSKKLKTLDLLPILESAPESTRNYLAEAIRCYLLKMDRACIALCRACVEDTLNHALTGQMQNEWRDEFNHRKKGSMEALIDVCVRHDVIGKHRQDAHYIREAGNRVLHLQVPESASANSDVAGHVLKKTCTLIGFIHGNRSDRK